jgi:coenzyme PQQ synthesis protein D (PqqD)
VSAVRRTLDSRVQIRDDVLFEQSHGEAVLLDPASGIYFGLSPVGARIWQLFASLDLLSDVANAISAEYNVSVDRCAADLIALVQELDAHGLVTVR